MYLSTDQLSIACPSASRPLYAVETLHEQGSGEQNEDTLLWSGTLFGVFDGATSLDKYYDEDGATGGLCAASIAAETFRDHSGCLPQAAKKANRLLREKQIRCRIPLNQRQRLWSTSMAVIRMHDSSFEYCHTGDSMIVLLYRDGGYSLLSPELDIDGETLELWQNTASGDQSIHTILAEQITKVRLQMNVTYGVLNGEPESMQFLRHGRESLAGVSDILLFTDGLLLPKADPRSPSDWQAFAALYRNGGLAAIRDHVRALQRDDSTCRRYPRFKTHDDIAAIAVTVDHGNVSPAHMHPRSS
jgi:hypothetical protein